MVGRETKKKEEKEKKGSRKKCELMKKKDGNYKMGKERKGR